VRIGAPSKAKLARLISLGADINTENGTPLYKAAMHGNLAIVKMLVDLGANIHMCKDMALRVASLDGRLDVVRYLVSRGANITAVNNYSIRLASAFEQLETAWYLACNGANEAYLSHKARQYGAIWQRSQERRRTRASTRIYFWWIRQCYQMSNPSGIRMAFRNLAEYESLCAT
jgi:hypothetical protein